LAKSDIPAEGHGYKEVDAILGDGKTWTDSRGKPL
jgi:hypothetical protein